MSYVLLDAAGPVGVFSGGSLLFGTTGRTDLLGASHTRTLARQQHASARLLADRVPPEAEVWPTHGFGSFCSATQDEASSSTMRRELDVNPALRLDVADFVAETLAGLDVYPAYYAHMGARNLDGADLIDLSPPRRADPDELRDRISAGEWVVDLRSRRAYARRHLTGTLSFGLDGRMSTWLAWLTPRDAPLTLLGETAEEVAEAQRELARVGIDRLAAAAIGQPDEWSAGDRSRLDELATATFVDLAAARGGSPPNRLPRPGVVLDVRLGGEWRGGHLADAVHVPLPDLPGRLDELPRGVVWVHCSSGYRAGIAASLLRRSGRQVVNLEDEYAHAAEAGVPTITEEQA